MFAFLAAYRTEVFHGQDVFPGGLMAMGSARVLLLGGDQVRPISGG
jgi:hypothetical protein